MTIKNGLRSNPVGDIAAPPYTKEAYTWDAEVDFTTADALKAGGNIVSNEMVITVPINASSVDENIFVADDAWQVTSISEAHAVAAAIATVSLQVKKCSATVTPAAGTVMHSASVVLGSTVNTVQTATLTSTTADLQLASGERLALDYTGSLATLAGGVLTIKMKRV